jgi:hypothetical protein
MGFGGCCVKMDLIFCSISEQIDSKSNDFVREVKRAMQWMVVDSPAWHLVVPHLVPDSQMSITTTQ